MEYPLVATEHYNPNAPIEIIEIFAAISPLDRYYWNMRAYRIDINEIFRYPCEYSRRGAANMLKLSSDIIPKIDHILDSAIAQIRALCQPTQEISVVRQEGEYCFYIKNGIVTMGKIVNDIRRGGTLVNNIIDAGIKPEESTSFIFHFDLGYLGLRDGLVAYKIDESILIKAEKIYSFAIQTIYTLFKSYLIEAYNAAKA